MEELMGLEKEFADDEVYLAKIKVTRLCILNAVRCPYIRNVRPQCWAWPAQ